MSPNFLVYSKELTLPLIPRCSNGSNSSHRATDKKNLIDLAHRDPEGANGDDSLDVKFILSDC